MQTIPIDTNKKLADGAIDYIREAFVASLNWLNYTFPSVEVGKDDKLTYAECYLGTGIDSIKIIPDNLVGSFCFFEKINTDFGNFAEKNKHKLKVYFWLNLSLLTDLNVDTYVNDVCMILRYNQCKNISIDYQNDMKKYGFDDFIFPYTKFVIDFEVFSNNKC